MTSGFLAAFSALHSHATSERADFLAFCGRTAVKHDRAQKFIRRLLREDVCIAEWSASLRCALGFPRLRFGTAYPNTMK